MAVWLEVVCPTRAGCGCGWWLSGCGEDDVVASKFRKRKPGGRKGQRQAKSARKIHFHESNDEGEGGDVDYGDSLDDDDDDDDDNLFVTEYPPSWYVEDQRAVLNYEGTLWPGT